MSEEIKIRRATLDDVDFLVDTIVAAEKSGTDNFGLAKLFELSESEMHTYIKAMLEEEIDGCEFSVSSFLVADHQGKAVAAFARWVKKGGEKHFGYKNHTKVDKGSKFIKKGVKRVMRKFGMKDKVIIKSRKIQKTDRTKRILCKFAASYFQILFNGPRMVWRCGAKMVKIKVPI